MSDFKPKYKYSISEQTVRLERLMEKINTLERETKSLIAQRKEKRPNLSYSKKLKANHMFLINISRNNLRLKDLHKERRQMQKEIEAMAKGITQPRFADDTLITYNECVGICYGKGIFINNDGELLYKELDGEELVIGMSIEEYDTLEPIGKLPETDKELIVGYIADSPNTPMWLKENLKD